jgi:DnaJ-class molecular chaperone
LGDGTFRPEVTTTTAIAPQAVETACDECAGDGQLAYDLEAAIWVPRSATADWPADDCIGISVSDCQQCDGTGTVRLDPRRGNRPTRSGR